MWNHMEGRSHVGSHVESHGGSHVDSHGGSHVESHGGPVTWRVPCRVT